MGEVIILGVLGIFLWIAYKWGTQKQQPAPAQNNANDYPVGSESLQALQDWGFGPNYASPSTGSVPERISGTLWGGQENWIDKIFSGLNSLLGGSDSPETSDAQQPAAALPYGAPPAGITAPLSFGNYAGDAPDWSQIA